MERTRQAWSWRVPLIITGFLTLLMLANLVARNGDPMAFVFQGEIFKANPIHSGTGYDGQYTYWIASRPMQAFQEIPEPEYRLQRILFPVLAWLFSVGGKESLIAWAMLIINLSAVGLSAVSLSRLLTRRGGSPWLSLVYFLFGGTLFTLLMDLNEILALGLALTGIDFLDRNRLGWAGWMFALGGLAKEVALVFAAGAAAWLLVTRKNWKGAAQLFLVSIIPYLVWSCILTGSGGHSILSYEMTRMEWLPFYGSAFMHLDTDFVVLLPWVILPVALFIILAVKNLFRRTFSLEVFFLLANIALIAFMPRYSWVDMVAVLRLTMGLVIAGLLFFAVTYPRWTKWMYLWTSSALVPVAFAALLAVRL